MRDAVSDLLSGAIQAVLDACEVCREVQSDLARVGAVLKSDRSPVTVADFASQAVVGASLRERIPGVRLVAEESASDLDSDARRPLLDAVVDAVRRSRPGMDRGDVLSAIGVGGAEPDGSPFWTLDPVDGTKGFLRSGQYAIALALIDGGAPVLGVLGCPNLSLKPGASPERSDTRGSVLGAEGRTLVACEAVRGSAPAPFRRPERAPGSPLRMCGSVEAAHSDQGGSERAAHAVDPDAVLLRFDSQCKYGAVASGIADAYLRLPTRPGYVERIWDHAAGSAVASAAGCVVTDLDGRPLDFSRGRGLEANRGVVCAGPEWHGRLLRAIRG